MNSIFNLHGQIARRRTLRRNSTQPEKLPWSRLRANQIKGHKFRRQFGIGAYIVDFYCPTVKLAIEIDGDSHFLSDKTVRQDNLRQKMIENLGIMVVRFTNTDVMTNLNQVVEKISSYLP